MLHSNRTTSSYSIAIVLIHMVFQLTVDRTKNIFLSGVHTSTFISSQTILGDTGEKVPIGMAGAALTLHLSAAAPTYYFTFQNVIC